MLNIIGVPIGNLEDLSYRQARTLCSSDIILAEDTRAAQTLLHAVKNLFGIEPIEGQRIISYYKQKEFDKLPQIITDLEQRKEVSLISEAGMPVISDPGYLLIKTAIARSIPYTVIPGPSAVTTALLHTDFKTDQFMFIGFLPKKESHLIKMLKQLQEVKKIMKDVAFVAFESPHRIHATLKIIDQIVPESRVVITRELTKKFEEIYHGKAGELIENEYRGEITIVMNI